MCAWLFVVVVVWWWWQQQTNSTLRCWDQTSSYLKHVVCLVIWFVIEMKAPGEFTLFTFRKIYGTMTVIQITTAPSSDRCQKPKEKIIRATDLALAMLMLVCMCIVLDQFRQCLFQTTSIKISVFLSLLLPCLRYIEFFFFVLVHTLKKSWSNR